MKKSAFTLLLLAVSFLLRAQAPGIQWQQSFGGDDDDVLLVVKPTSDGGYIVGGFSLSSNNGDKTDTSRGFYDIWVLKLDPQRNIEWQRSLGGSGDESISDIIQTADSGYVLFGMSGSDVSGDKTDTARDGWPLDMWLVKLDKSGAIEWQKTIGGDGLDGACLGITIGAGVTNWNIPITIRVVQETDGFVIALPSASGISGEKTDTSRSGSLGFYSIMFPDIWIVKVNNSGVIQWQKTIGAELDEAPVSFMADPAGGYIVGAISSSGISGEKTDTNRAGHPVSMLNVLNGEPVYDYWILKLDNTGNIEWQKTIGADSNDILVGVRPLPQGGYIAGGYSNSSISGEKTIASRGKSDFWIVKLDDTGRIEWQKVIGGNDEDYLLDIQLTADSGFILAGGSISDSSGEKTSHVSGYSDYWLVKLDAQGDIEWQKTIGGTNDGTAEMATTVYQTPDGDYVVGGGSSASNSGDKTSPGRGEADFWLIGLACEVDTTVTVSGDTMLTAAQSGASYQWIDCSTGDPAPGATTQSFIPAVTGNYQVVVTLKGCRDTSACYHVEVKEEEEDGINDLSGNTSELSLYPNPAADQVSVKSATPVSLIRIVNITGATMLTYQADGKMEINLDLGGLATGIYTIRIETGNGPVIRKLEIIN